MWMVFRSPPSGPSFSPISSVWRADASELSQGFENALDLLGAFLVFAAETSGKLLRGGGGVGGEELADQGDLIGEAVGPGNGRFGIGNWRLGGIGAGDGALLRRPMIAATVLIVRAEPANEAALFLGGALVVEGDEAGEEFGFALAREGVQVGPDVGFEHGGIQLVVNVPKKGDKAVVLDLLLFGVEKWR